MTPDDEKWARGLVGRDLNGRYRLEQTLGMGGMGAVFVATHLAVGRRVAVKMLLPDLAADENVVRRFHQEARAAAAVARRGVVDILDYDVDPTCGPYLVMELLEGEPLSRRIARLRRLELADIVWIGDSILRTLAAVHAQGIVHRDLKPDNVFLSAEDGEELVKILDFGISRVMTAGSPQRESALLTRPGVVLGTPTYMAPEQARAEPSVDHRADLYAVGAILYECAAGRPPHVGDNWQQVFAAVLTAPPPPLRSLRTGLPDTLYALIERALSRDPRERPADAVTMRAELVATTAPVPRTRVLEANQGTYSPPVARGMALPTPAGAPGPVGPGTPYAAVSTPAARPARGGRGLWIAGGVLALGLVVAAGAAGTVMVLASQSRDRASDDAIVEREPVPLIADASRVDPPPDANAASEIATAPDAGSTETSDDSSARLAKLAVPDRGRRGDRTARATTRDVRTAAEQASATAVTPDLGAIGPGVDMPPPDTEGDGVERGLRARFAQAEAARQARRFAEARRGYEDVVSMAWTAQVPTGSASARLAAQARMAIGDMDAARIRPMERPATPDEFSERWTRLTNAYSAAATQYGRVGMYGHSDLTQCAMVRSGRAAEALADATKAIRAPESIAALGADAASRFEEGFRSAYRSYLEVAKTTYEAAVGMPSQSGCRAQAMDGHARVMRELGQRMP